MKQPTQSDLAALLGMTQPAISLALREDPRIPKTTQQKVRRAARKLGYRVRSDASRLASSRWERPGISRSPVLALLDTRTNEGFNTLLDGARRRARQLGYETEVIKAWKFSDARRLSSFLFNRGIQGVILSQQVPGEKPFNLQWKKFCAVSCGFLSGKQETTCVRADLRACAMAALSLLPEDGSPVVVWLKEAPGMGSEVELSDAARAWMARHQPRRRVTWIVENAEGEFFLKAVERVKRLVAGVQAHLVATYEWMLKEAPTVPAVSAGPKVRQLFLYSDKTAPAGSSGAFVDPRELGATAVELLDIKLRTNDFGCSPHAITVMVPPIIR